VSDLALGVRLAVGGGRTSLARFALSTIGITLAVAVLLIAASVGNMMAERDHRMNLYFANIEQIDGVDPVLHVPESTTFRGETVEMHYVHPTGPNPPELPGVRDVPAAGEVYLSPRLAELLRSDEGELLRPRFADYTEVGEVGKLGVREPGNLVAWIGTSDDFAESDWYQEVYVFGSDELSGSLGGELLAIVLVGAVVLLLPVLIFVSSASRIAGAERDRRLSALRLVGSGSRQVRRIAAAESLVSALAGLVLGAAVFLVARQYAEDIELFGTSVYTSDIVPNPLLVLLIVLLIPGLAVFTALIALRRTIIEPLGVVRQSKPVRRRAWWRFAMIIAGVVLLLTQLGAREGDDLWSIAVAAGATLLLVGVPVLLPWLIERVVGRIQGGPTSWQLAIRRLQLDSGTAARVVGGVAVVLAGAIALQTVLMTVEGDLDFDPMATEERQPTIDITVGEELADPVAAELSESPGVREAYVIRTAIASKPGDTSNEYDQYLQVMDCAAAEASGTLKNCVDGEIYEIPNSDAPAQRSIEPGERLEFRDYPQSTEFDQTDYEVVGNWIVPDEVNRVVPDEVNRVEDYNRFATGIIVTPGALGDTTLPADWSMIYADVEPGITSDQLEGLRNVVAPYQWRVSMYSYNTVEEFTDEQEEFLAIRNGLYVGSVFTLMLAGVSLLVLALEHIRERRRPLAVLAASGVPRSVLGRSLLWQIALPIAVGVVVALATGIGLAALIMQLTNEGLAIDWVGVSALTAGALLLSLLVSALTLPFLRSATRLTALRAE
jgi:hypothetical protein